MSHSIIFSFANQIEINSIQNLLTCEIGDIEIGQFPDEESHIRICSDVKNKQIFLIVDLAHPNCKLLDILFITNTLKKMGSKKIILIAPYLPYMRQDKQFHEGEIISANLFATILSPPIDGLITIDPHLHRIHHLNEIYPLASISTLHATKPIAKWILDNTNDPLLFGPDEESEQWLSEIASYTHCNYLIGKKVRLGDQKVTITLPRSIPAKKQIIIIDDIISSGASMLSLTKQLQTLSIAPISCITVHALFSRATYNKLIKVGLKSIVSTNTIPHFTNKIDVSPLIADEMMRLSTTFLV